jgi:hypothetical protein
MKLVYPKLQAGLFFGIGESAGTTFLITLAKKSKIEV